MLACLLRLAPYLPIRGTGTYLTGNRDVQRVERQPATCIHHARTVRRDPHTRPRKVFLDVNRFYPAKDSTPFIMAS